MNPWYRTERLRSLNAIGPLPQIIDAAEVTTPLMGEAKPHCTPPA